MSTIISFFEIFFVSGIYENLFRRPKWPWDMNGMCFTIFRNKQINASHSSMKRVLEMIVHRHPATKQSSNQYDCAMSVPSCARASEHSRRPRRRRCERVLALFIIIYLMWHDGGSRRDVALTSMEVGSAHASFTVLFIFSCIVASCIAMWDVPTRWSHGKSLDAL